MIDGARTDTRNSPARDLRGAGNISARQRAINRSSRVRIRPIRPHTATSNTVRCRSRAATTAIAACRLERREEKFSLSFQLTYKIIFVKFFLARFPRPSPTQAWAREQRRSKPQPIHPQPVPPPKLHRDSEQLIPQPCWRQRDHALVGGIQIVEPFIRHLHPSLPVQMQPERPALVERQRLIQPQGNRQRIPSALDVDP